jgi:MYND finger
MVHLCEACDEPTTRRCSGCKIPTAWYCSENCQRELWNFHIYECNPINTAYHLTRAVYADRLPDDRQTCEDFGFAKAFTAENRSNLLGLYQGLIKHIGVEPKEIHRWRRKGTLAEEIKSAFEELPQSSRGGYYPWFIQNQWVINPELAPPTDTVHEALLRVWRYMGGSPSSTREEIRVATASWPQHKQECSFFCTILLSSWHPSPDQAAWLNFGFCVCRNEYSETPLAQLYLQLIARASFDEIYTAYESSKLIALFDSKGLKHDREQIHHLADVLAGSPHMNKSVWDLKRHIALEDGCMIPSIGVDYGFANCEGEAEMLELKEVYKQFFDSYNSDPIKLHETVIEGRLFEYVGGFVKMKKKFKRLMKNPYPLQQATLSSV